MRDHVDLTDEMKIIPKNSQILVKRVPAISGKRLNHQMASTANISHAIRSNISNFPQAAGFGVGAGAGGDENSRIKEMMAANVIAWEKNQQDMPLQQNGPRRLFRPPNWRGPVQTPPDTYVCFRCGEKGTSPNSSTIVG